MLSIRPIEFFLIQFVCYLGLWLYDDYLGSLMSILLAGVFLVILLVSLIVEWIEPSRVPRKYFYMMGVSVLAPLLALVVYLGVMGGRVEWLV